MGLFQAEEALPPALGGAAGDVVVFLFLVLVLEKKLVAESGGPMEGVVVGVGVLEGEKAALEEELVGGHHRVVGDGEFEIGGHGRGRGRGGSGGDGGSCLLEIDEVAGEGDSGAGRRTVVEGLMVGVVHV